MLPSVYLDFEQFWRDWAAYMRGDYATAYATRFTPQQLDTYYRRVHGEVYARLFGTGIEVGNYSADWFIDRYAPNMKTWAFDNNYWEAKYLRYYNPTGLANAYKTYGKPIPIDSVQQLQSAAPIANGIMRQFESLLYVRGLYEHQDWNFITDEGFNKMFQMDVPVEPTPPIIPPVITKTYIVNTWSLNIRSGAGVTYSWVGSYIKGAKVSVFEISGDWGKTEKGWINLNYTLPIQGSYMVNTVWLNIRQSAFATSAIVGGLKFGDIVYELDRSGVWINIGKGWVNSNYLKPV